ncbi:MAG: transglutaminase-like domain-containing protein [Gemmataceae bacterium]
MRASDRLVRLLTLALAAVAGGVATAAWADAVRVSFADHALWLGLSVVVGIAQSFLLPRDAEEPPPRWAYVAFVVVVAFPIVQQISAHARLEGLPLELTALLVLRNTALALVLLAAWPTCSRLSAMTSLFVVAFGSCMSELSAIPFLLGAFAATGCLWLMAAAWNMLGERRVGERRFPWLAALAMFLVVSTVAAGMAMGPRKLGAPLAEWFGSSGGTTRFDPQSRRGVGEGDQEVASDNPTSIGFQVTDTFVEAKGQSLYDVISDMYGEGHKPNKNVERMIALSTNRVVNLGSKPPESLKASRDFPTMRTPAEVPTAPLHTAPSKALLHLRGRLPLHLRLVAYDRFDGNLLHEAAPSTQNNCVATATPLWFSPPQAVRSWTHPQRVSHDVKIGMLASESLPTPSLLQRFRMGKVDQANFFAWSTEGILRLQGRSVPRGTGIVYESDVVEPSAVARITLQRDAGSGDEADPAISELAKEWTSGLPSGWPQVAAVAARLQSDYVHDPMHSTPVDAGDTAVHFLCVSKRGPDYMFATSAALLLRSLGYSTRVVSGLYASPKNYVPHTGHASLFAKDMHFWAEVRTHGGDWLIVEPTPGFAVLGPEPTLWERICRLFAEAGQWLAAHRFRVGCVVAAGVSLWLSRRFLIDAIATFCWSLHVRRSAAGIHGDDSPAGTSRRLDR